jgi:hypothetical protein
MLIEGLQTKIEMLQRLTSEFVIEFSYLRIVSFYELRLTRSQKILVRLPLTFNYLMELTLARLLKRARRCSRLQVNPRSRSMRTTIRSARSKKIIPKPSYVYVVIPA